MNSWPEAFIQRIHQQYPDSASEFLDALNLAPVTSFRLNPLKTPTQLELEGIPWYSGGYYIKDRPSFTLDPWFHAGMYYVQEASSMFVAHALQQVINFEEDLAVLDLCGAPGGKSTLIASLLTADSLLVANEVIRSRAQILSENLQKWGVHQAIVTQNDPEDFHELQGFFDLMLIDAPCSGEGLFRRDPKAADQWSPDHVQLCSDRQKRILLDAWDSLKPGGVLAYSTCTFNEAENEHNLEWLLTQVDATPIEIAFSKEWGIVQSTYKDLPGYRFLPHKLKGEGFFLTLIKKGEEGRVFNFRKKKKKNSLLQLGKDIEALVAPWVKEGSNLSFYQEEAAIFAFSQKQEDRLEVINKKLNVLHKGLDIGEIKKKQINPTHGLILSPYFQYESFPGQEVSHRAALTFLKKESLSTDLPKGWGYLTFGGVPLGWLKQIPGRANNYYPSHWRIRMNIPEQDWYFSMKDLVSSKFT